MLCFFSIFRRIRNTYILTYSVLAYVDISKMQTVRQSRNDTFNAVQLLFIPKFIPEMTRVAPDIISGTGRIWPPDMRPDLTICWYICFIVYFRWKTYISKLQCLSHIMTQLNNSIIIHRSRIRYLSKKNSRILTNFPKLKKFVKIRTKIR